MLPWNKLTTNQFERDAKRWMKDHRDEFSAVMANLQRYLNLLKEVGHPFQAKAGYVHIEPDGIIALDQRGADRKLKETRLYVFPYIEKENLYLLKIGDKQSQHRDIQQCRCMVSDIKQGIDV